MVFPFTCEYLYFKIAMVILRITYSQKNTIATEYRTAAGLKAISSSNIMPDHPSRVRVWKTVNIDQNIVSKLIIEKLGFYRDFPQMNPSLQVEP